MKRLVTFMTAFFTVILMTACASPLKDETSAENRLGSSFESSVSIVIDKLNAEGVIKRLGEGAWEVEFSEPNTLSGVKLEFGEGNVKASYKGLNFSVPQSALPVKAMMLNLIAAVDENAKLEELSGVENEGRLEVNGSLEGGDYILCVDKEGRLSSFAMDNNKLNMSFSDVKEISGLVNETTTESAWGQIEETTMEETTDCDTEEAAEIDENGENAEETVIIEDNAAEEAIEIPEIEVEEVMIDEY